MLLIRYYIDIKLICFKSIESMLLEQLMRSLFYYSNRLIAHQLRDY